MASDKPIAPEIVRLVSRDLLPRAWAAELGRLLSPALDQAELDLLQERVLGLGHGVQLAHIRTHRVGHPTLAAWKASDVTAEDGDPWLWLAVLVPSGDASRHLGWMAHLAAGLHDADCRADLLQAVEAEPLSRALTAMLAVHTHRYRSKLTPKVSVTEPTAQVTEAAASASVTTAAPAATAGHRLLVAILKEVEIVDHVLQLFVDHDVRGATVLEARGMAEHLAAHMSLFAGFKSAFRAVGHSQLILTLVPTDRCDEVLELIRDAAGGMDNPGSGIAFALDVPAVVGFNKGG